MITFDESYVDLELIEAESRQFKYSQDDGHVDMAITQSGGLPPHIMEKPGIAAAVLEIATRRKLNPVNVMVNWVTSGAPVPKHRDWIKPTPLQKRKPCIERWHLAVRTNKSSFWWDEKNGYIHFPYGCWCGPVPYWTYHTVVNDGDSPRLHILVDLDTIERVGHYEEDG